MCDGRAENGENSVRWKIPWDQAWLGGDAGWLVNEEYPADGIPSIWFIGPDGVVIANDLRGDQISSTVAAKLSR
jgi:hypothetical protein